MTGNAILDSALILGGVGLFFGFVGSIAIAVLLAGWLQLVGGWQPVEELTVSGGSFVERLLVVNVFLVIFTLLAIYPVLWVFTIAFSGEQALSIADLQSHEDYNGSLAYANHKRGQAEDDRLSPDSDCQRGVLRRADRLLRPARASRLQQGATTTDQLR